MITLSLLLACTVPAPPAPTPSSAPPVETPRPPSPAVATPAVPPPPPGARLQDEQNSVDVFKAAAPATVFVTQSQLVVDWRMRALEVPAGTGSGFVWDDKGHVVTNYHVVNGAQSLSVTLYDGSEHPATFVGGEPRKDIAIVKIDVPPDKLVPVRRPPGGYSLEVGQKTLAIGNPFGLDHTLTVGTVSALGREVMGFGEVPIKGMIQTDASINPGNSGGPLLDSQGQLIGMNTMIFSKSGSSAGIGFAVPWTTIERVVDQILTHGRVQQVGIGVSLVDDRVARQNRIDGVVIYEVMPGSPAERAGLRGLRQQGRRLTVGDVIVAIDGKEIRQYGDLYTALDEKKPGERVRLRFLRDNQPQETEIELVVVNPE